MNYSNIIVFTGMVAAACIGGTTENVADASAVAIGEAEKACTMTCQNDGHCKWYEFDCTDCPGPIEYMYCDCPDGFEGHQCEILTVGGDEQAEKQPEDCTLRCDNGGECTWVDHLEIPRYMICDCANGFEGDSCEHEVDDEGVDPFSTIAPDVPEDDQGSGGAVTHIEQDCTVSCNNGGVCKWNLWDCGHSSDCISSPYMYCDCPPGFEGPLCEKGSAVGSRNSTLAQHGQEEMKTCSLECANGGECVTESVECRGNDCITFELMHCECPQGFEGDLCDKKALENRPNQLEKAQEDAPCTKDCSGNGMCQWEEWDCTQSVDCIAGFKYMKCDCDDGYVGNNCEYNEIDSPSAGKSSGVVEPKNLALVQEEDPHVQAEESQIPRRIGAEVVAILAVVGAVVVSLALIALGVRINGRRKASIASADQDEATIVAGNASKDAAVSETGLSADIV